MLPLPRILFEAVLRSALGLSPLSQYFLIYSSLSALQNAQSSVRPQMTQPWCLVSTIPT